MPVPGASELVVQMQAAGVAFGDIAQRQGRNPARSRLSWAMPLSLASQPSAPTLRGSLLGSEWPLGHPVDQTLNTIHAGGQCTARIRRGR